MLESFINYSNKRFLPTHTNMRMKAIDNEIRTTLMRIINQRVKAMEVGESTNNYLFGILLESNYKEFKKIMVEE